MDKRIINLLLIIVVLILIAINIKIFIDNHEEENITVPNNITINDNSIKQEEIQNTITSKVADMSERSRMQTYFGTFISYIEGNNYESAYNLLNEDFKNNYFSTIEQFQEYMQKYPKNIAVDYQDIERQGELFVLTVEIKDVYNNDFQKIAQRVVIRELGVNRFTISFQVE